MGTSEPREGGKEAKRKHTAHWASKNESTDIRTTGDERNEAWISGRKQVV